MIQIKKACWQHVAGDMIVNILSQPLVGHVASVKGTESSVVLPVNLPIFKKAVIPPRFPAFADLPFRLLCKTGSFSVNESVKRNQNFARAA